MKIDSDHIKKNLHRIAQFSKVSYEQYKKDILSIFPNSEEKEIEKSYNEIILPTRATSGSSGYDFFAPMTFVLDSGDSFVIPTGIRVNIEDGWWLMLMPRSGSGFKYYVRLANTIGNIDSDYFDATNEGHIMIKIRRESNVDDLRHMIVNSGDAFAQGVFVPFGITIDDEVDTKRVGGIGSTDNKG